MQCNAPIDPVRLIIHYLHEVQRTGISRTRYVQRFTPVSASGSASLAGLRSLAEKLIPQAFEDLSPNPCTYKVQIKIRSHNTVQRSDAIEEVLQFVPRKHVIQLEEPDLVILVEIFKNTCGLSVVPEYYNLQKFNPSQILASGKEGKCGTEGMQITREDVVQDI